MRTLIFLCFLVLASTALAETQKGIAAFESKRYDAAIKELRPAAEAGDPQAQLFLAKTLRALIPNAPNEFRIHPVETNAAQGEVTAWLAKAAQQNVGEAMVEYANNLEAGFGVPVDFAKAVEWLQKAAAAGERHAHLKLAEWYSMGHILTPSHAKFREHTALAKSLRKEEPEGNSSIDNFVALAGKLRDAQDKLDPEKYQRDLTFAEAGDAAAARRYAEEVSREGSPIRDCAAAAKWYERSGDLGKPSSYVDLGEFYLTGRCDTQDLAKARVFFGKAAEGASTLGLWRLARMQVFGHGAAPDYAAAYETLQLLASLSATWIPEQPSMFNVARRHLTPEQIAASDKRVAERAPALKQLYKRQDQRVTTRPVASGASAERNSWAFDFKLVDKSGECAANVLGVCDYVPFEAVIDIKNPDATTLDCKLVMPVKFMPRTEWETLDLRFVLLPRTDRQPKIGHIKGAVDIPRTTMTCAPVASPRVEDGNCALLLPPGADPGKFYRKEAAKAGLEGPVKLAITLPKTKAKPADVQVQESSGHAAVDKAAVDFARETSFDTNCPNASLPLRLVFKL
jgi:uncharacterized protein